MPKGEWYDGPVIKGSRCPKCNNPIIYNGNYWCSECPWILPEFPRKAEDKHAFNVAYILYMKQTNRQPNSSVLYKDVF